MFSLPFVFQAIQSLGLIFVIRHDSLDLQEAFLNKEKAPEIYNKTISLLYYKKDNSQAQVDQFMGTKFGENKNQDDGEDDEIVTIGMALCSAKYRKLTLFGVALACMSQLDGLNLIVSYLFPFFDEINIDPNFGSLMYGLACVVGAVISPFILNLSFMNVRRGFIVGNALLCISMACLCLSIHIDSQGATLASILIFAIVL